jgi:short-subunit dehydrogenase
MPLIRNASGRIIWIMTPAIIPTPYVTTIHACDFARNCIARTFNIELKSWGIKNIMIKCGGIKTPAGMRTIADVESLLQNTTPDTNTLYEKSFLQWAREMHEFDKKRTEPMEVARKILTALNANKPKTRYYVGHLARIAQILEIMPQSLADWILSKRFKIK